MWKCPDCGTECEGAFCGECGARRPEPVQIEPDNQQVIPAVQPADETNREESAAQDGVLLTRKAIKENAKAALKAQYGTLLCTVLIITAVACVFGGLIGAFNGMGASVVNSADSAGEYVAGFSLSSLSGLFNIINLLVTSVLGYGLCNTMRMAYCMQPVRVSNLFDGFRYYGRMLGGYLWSTLWIFLWALIPIVGIVLAIIKGYSYSMMPYILFTHPELTIREALKKSISMTEGNKGKLFVLDLSFIGWGLLSVLTCGLLFVFYLTQYISLTKAGYYEALEKGQLAA